VQLHPGLLGHGRVDGVADQQVAELVAGLGGQPGRGRAQELAPHQPAQPGRHLGPGAGRRQLGHRVALEGLADHRGPLQQVPVAAVQPVETGRDQRLDGRGHGSGGQVAGHLPATGLAAQPALLDQGGQQLLDEQRVPAGGPGDPLPGRGGQGPGAGQSVQQRPRVVRPQRLQQHADGVGPAAGPGRALLQQLGPGDGDEQDRGLVAALAELLDQVEEGRLGPVEVVEHHNERALGGQGLQQAAGRPGGLLDRGRVGLQPDQLPDPLGHQVPVGVAPVDQGGQLGPGRRRRVLQPDPGRLADHLGQRPEGAAVAVGQAAAEQQGRLALQPGGQVDDVPDHQRAAHPGVAGHDLAGVDAGVQLQPHPPLAPQPVVQLGQGGVHVAGRPDRPQGVVLVGGRDAEHGHDGVAGELLDRAAVAADDRPHGLVVAGHDPRQRLGVEPLAQGRGAAQVAEDHGHGLAGAAGPGRARGQRLAAGQAEPRPPRVRLPAGRTADRSPPIVLDARTSLPVPRDQGRA